jgi:hypothetical protein
MQTDKLLNRSIGSKGRGELVQNFSAVASAAGSGILRLRFSLTTSIFSSASHFHFHFQILFLFLLLLRIKKIKFNKKSPNKNLLPPLAVYACTPRSCTQVECYHRNWQGPHQGHDPSSTLGLSSEIQHA